MKITKEMRIGLISMVAIARNGEKALTATSIAAEQGLTKPFVEKIFSKLRRSGIVNAIKGPGGGYKLSKDVNDISVKEIFDVLSSSSAKKNEPSNTPEQEIADNLMNCYTGIGRDFLGSTTLEVLINGKVDISNKIALA